MYQDGTHPQEYINSIEKETEWIGALVAEVVKSTAFWKIQMLMTPAPATV